MGFIEVGNSDDHSSITAQITCANNLQTLLQNRKPKIRAIATDMGGTLKRERTFTQSHVMQYFGELAAVHTPIVALLLPRRRRMDDTSSRLLLAKHMQAP